MSVFTLAIPFDLFQFALTPEPNIPGSYVILLFTALDLASITSHIPNWVLFLLWLHPFILSGVISPLISSSILGTYRPGEFSFSILSFCLFILFMVFSTESARLRLLRSGREELPHLQGQGRWLSGATSHPWSGSCMGAEGPRGATPRSRSGGATSSKVRSSSCTLLEQP